MLPFAQKKRATITSKAILKHARGNKKTRRLFGVSDKKPNDRNTNRRVKPAGRENAKQRMGKNALEPFKVFFKDVGSVFASGYKKYDAFIRRIFKLDAPPEDNLPNQPAAGRKSVPKEDGGAMEELRGLTRQRKAAGSGASARKPSFEEGDTQDYGHLQDYLQKKKYDSPAPLDDLEPRNRENEDDGHHWNIFKKRQKPRSFFTSVFLGVIKISVALMLIMATSGLGVVQGIANAYVDTTPELDLTKIENQDETSFIYDGNGNMVTSFIGLENRISASLDEIPEILKSAFVAVEDERFYTHNGIDIKRIVGALFNNFRTDTTQGGSTITTQIIKLKLLSSEQTYKRKIQEAYLAMQLEKNYTKDEILVSYMNTINLGSGNYGVKAAARDYFGKELNELTLRECAMLAAIARSSYLYNPRLNYYARSKPENTDSRTDEVLYKMYRNGYISQSEHQSAIQEQVYVIEESPKQQMYDMPYFLEYAIDDVVAHFIRQRNLDNNATNRNKIENELRTSGYHIYTTVDPTVQQIVEDSLYNWERYPRTKYDSDASVMVQNTDGTSQEVIQPQAAAVVFDYHTGQLKAIVGGRQEPQVKKALNRAIAAHMPVGSSIKPLSVYGPALHAGVPPTTVIFDLPLPIEGWISEKGYPRNYGGTFSGPVTMREALYRSINNAAARVLMEYVTLDESYRTLESLGISTSSISKDGSGLALGTSGISVFEMAVAYGAIGNSGIYTEPIAFTQVVDSDGNILLDASAPSVQIRRTVFSPSANWLLIDMMTDVVEKGTGKNAHIDGITVAGKTGTNTEYRGVFFSGITPYYSAALWIGHDRYEPLYSGAQGGRDAAPLWQSFMSEIHDELNLTDRPIMSESPESLGLVRVRTCPISGKLATEACESDIAGYKPVTDWVQPDSVPTKECDLHHIFRICLTSGKIATPFCKEGSDTDPYSYVVIPPDHIANQLTDEEFAEYFPSGWRGLPEDLEQLTYDNPDYAHLFCHIHTQEWYENKVKIETITASSQSLINQVEEILLEYASVINAEVKLLAEGYIDDLKEAIKTAAYNTIETAYTNLNTFKAEQLDPIVAGGLPTEEPTPTPSPSSSEEPTPSPSPEG